MDYDQLPVEARNTIELIIKSGPFPYRKDGTKFDDRFGDLQSQGDYLEFTVPTPGVNGRGARRIVARKNGILFFTACHYERIQGRMSQPTRRQLTEKLDPEWRNGFYIITGMNTDKRNRILLAIKRLREG
ncbi:MAG: hypothetical protein GY814_03725 [Gammaproteobacteria bacterium]|nr:hypothetical protein [Gammaproteobacteria bacterium]